jgi:beta-hydroxylase
MRLQAETLSLPGIKPGAMQDLNNRNFTRAPPTGWIARGGLRMQALLERLVAQASVLPDQPVYDTASFPWVAELEANWRLIRAELDSVLAFRDRMPSFHEILKEVQFITSDDTWKTYFLIGTGMDCTENARRCPQTMQLLQRIPGVCTAFFSILSPGKHIPAHRGAYNGVLRFHLGLLVPAPAERCRIRVANELHCWNEGEGMVFDDTFNHEVWNDTDGWRVVLFVDFARPLRQPWDLLNRRFIRLGALAPFLRDAGRKQKRWERMFYGGARD